MAPNSASGCVVRRRHFGARSLAQSGRWSFATRRIAGVVALLVLLAVAIDLGHLIDVLLRGLAMGQRVDRARCVRLHRPAQPLSACRARPRRVRVRRHRGGAARRRHDRRPRSREPRPGRHLPRGDRIERGEFLRRRGRARVLVRAVRPARPVRLQGGQHGGLDDRPSWRALCGVRLGGGAARRRAEPHSRAPVGTDHRVGGASRRRQHRDRAAYDAARRAPAPLAQCGLAGERRWPARSASRWRGRAATAKRSSTIRS